MSDFDFREFQNFADNFKDAQSELDDFLRNFLLEMALRVIAKAKPGTPVITGALRALWGIGGMELTLVQSGSRVSVDPESSTVATVEDVTDGYQIVIWNGAEYASFIEYGSSTRSGSWREGRYMLTISMNQIEQQMPARFQSQFKKIMADRGL